MNKFGRLIPIELVFWCSAIVYLTLIEPHAPSHFSFCILNNLGATWCPGCGLGKSVSHLLHGNVLQSFAVHPMGVVALPVIGHRIAILIRSNLTINQP